MYKLAVIAATIFLFEISSSAEEFRAEGILNVKYVDENTNVIQQQSETFEVSVKGCKWFIVTIPDPPLDKDNTTRWEIGSEGSNEIYQIDRFDKKTLPPNALNQSIGAVENDTVPKNIAGNQVAEIWLAFASGCYFDSVTNRMLKPVYWLMDDSLRAKDYVVNAEWKRFDSAPRLPQQVVYTEDQIEGSYHGKIITTPAPPPFEKGYTRAEYNAYSTTNVGNLIIPKEFSFKEFAVVRTSKTDSHLVMYRVVEGHLTDAQPDSGRNEFIPALTEATVVDEERFSRSQKPILALSYMVTNGVWPRTNSPILQALYDHEIYARAHALKPIDAVPQPSVQEVRGKRLFIVLFMILSLFPLGFLVKKTWNSGEKK